MPRRSEVHVPPEAQDGTDAAGGRLPAVPDGADVSCQGSLKRIPWQADADFPCPLGQRGKSLLFGDANAVCISCLWHERPAGRPGRESGVPVILMLLTGAQSRPGAGGRGTSGRCRPFWGWPSATGGPVSRSAANGCPRRRHRRPLPAGPCRADRPGSGGRNAPQARASVHTSREYNQRFRLESGLPARASVSLPLGAGEERPEGTGSGCPGHAGSGGGWYSIPQDDGL